MMPSTTEINTANWEMKKLGELGKLFCGQSPPATNVNKSGIGTIYVTGPEQWNGTKIHVSKWTTDPKRVVPDGCIFITVKGAGVGKTFPGIPCAIGRDIYAFKPNDDVSQKFIYWAIIFSVQDVIQHAVGDIPGLSKSHILDHEILVPPFEQQEVVVAEIEKQFSRLDETVTALKRIQANLKRHKSSILKAAVEGKLTEQWRKEHPDVETADQLLKRILANRRTNWEGEELAKMIAKGFTPKDDSWKTKYKEPASPDTTNLPDLPVGWVWATYEQVGKLQLGRQRAPKYHTGPNMRLYLRVQNVFEDRIDLSDVMVMDFPPSDFEKYKLEPGDLLLNEGQSPELLGRPAIYRGELPGVCFTNTLIRFKAAEAINVDFVLTLTRHHMHSGRFVEEGTITTNIAHLSLGRLATVEVPLPPEDEQLQIASQVARFLSIGDLAGFTISANLKRTAKLRQTILKQGFAGDM